MPVPAPTPTPTPSSSPSSSPTVPGQALALVSGSADIQSPRARQATLTIATGETRGIWVQALTNDCIPISHTAGVTYQLFWTEKVNFAKPSYTGAPPSAYERLLPVDTICQAGLFFADVTGAGEVQFGDAEVELRANGRTFTREPSMPLYVGLNPYYTTVLKVDGHVSTQGPVVTSTVKLMRDNRMEPFSQYILPYAKVANGALVLDEWKEYQASFRQLVLDGAIAPPCLVPPIADTPASAYLKAVEAGLAAGTLPKGSWAYGWDEDQGGDTAAPLARIAAIKAGAPSLEIRATREEDPKFASVGAFIPILDWFKQPGHVQTYSKPYGLYTSCMAQGSCEGSVRAPSGAPMMVADALAVHIVAFPVMAAVLGAKHALYYSATEKFAVGSNYVANGNADGQLLYAGPSVVYPSVRLKLLREGMFMAEYYRLKPSAFAGLITSGKSFKQDYAAFQAARDVAAAVGAPTMLKWHKDAIN